jgi:hypothetical protein
VKPNNRSKAAKDNGVNPGECHCVEPSIHLPFLLPISQKLMRNQPSICVPLYSVVAIEEPRPKTEFERRLALKRAAIRLSQVKAQEYAAMDRLVSSRARLQVSLKRSCLAHESLLDGS